MTDLIVNNPLLIGQGLPPFERIHSDHVVPAITQLLAESEASLSQLETQLTPTWAGLVEPLEQIVDRLTWSWGIVGHLMGVKNSPDLRQAYETMQPEAVKFWNRLSQSQPLYQGFKALRDSAEWNTLEESQQRIVETSLRDAELSGVGLEGEAKERFNAIQLDLADLSTQFSNHVLDATKAFSLTLTQPDEIAGLPPSAVGLAAQMARSAGGQSAGDENATPEAGPWRITLDMPSYMPFMQHSQRRDLREQLYKAFVSRAASGEYDNRPLIEKILTLRREEAQLLGFNSFAEVSLAAKMAPSVEAVETLLEQLRKASYDAAKQDLETLRHYAKSKGAAEGDDLQHWDLAFWAERQREEKFDFNAEELRPYFPLDQVLDGLFNLSQKIFNVQISQVKDDVPVWHPDVRYFQVADGEGKAIASFYLDPYSRPAEKRGGAWMDDCISRTKMADGVRLPVAYLVCNQTPPVDDKPSLMTFGEVETLFHEFGHGLHHMLTRIDYSMAAGTRNVEWDAVELPSQFMENWCYHRATLLSLGKHYETGEPLPEHYYQKLLAARTYMSGSAMLRQIHLSWVDLELHHGYQPGGSETAADVRRRLAKTTMVLDPLPEDSFLCAFGHIFAGGYAAGYYSYKWAEVLSADAFAAFEEAGLENEGAIAQVGQRYRETVLAYGGGKHPMEVFKAFRGREPDTAALLRHNGLVAA
jgi:oligopeptidase A